MVAAAQRRRGHCGPLAARCAAHPAGYFTSEKRGVGNFGLQRYSRFAVQPGTAMTADEKRPIALRDGGFFVFRGLRRERPLNQLPNKNVNSH